MPTCAPTNRNPRASRLGYVLTSNLKSSRGAGFLEVKETASIHVSEGAGTWMKPYEVLKSVAMTGVTARTPISSNICIQTTIDEAQRASWCFSSTASGQNNRRRSGLRRAKFWPILRGFHRGAVKPLAYRGARRGVCCLVAVVEPSKIYCAAPGVDLLGIVYMLVWALLLAGHTWPVVLCVAVRTIWASIA